MELFFLIAGFFARLVLVRRGLGGFAWHRIQRILIPLVAGWMLVYPILAYEWITGAQMSGGSTRLQLPPEVLQLPAWQIVIGLFTRGLAFGENFSLTHLWFLYQLLVIYTLVLTARAITLQWLDRSGRLSQWLVTAFPHTLRAPWMVVFYAAVSTPILWGMAGWGVDTPDHSLIPSLPVTALYTLCFVVGWGLHRQPELLRAWPGREALFLLAGLILALVTANFGDLLRGLPLGPLPKPLAKLIYSALYAAMMWCFIVGVFGLFLRYGTGASRPWRYVADASYWLYIAHLPVVVAVQLLVAKWETHWSVKYPLILAMSFPVLFLSYHYLVRSTFIGQQLNGRRYARS